MADSWRRSKAENLEAEGVLRVEDGNHGEYRPRPHEFGAGTTSFIRAADIEAGQLSFQSADRISDAALHRIRKGVGEPGDVIFSHKGTVGKIALAPDDAPPFVCSPQTTFWRSLNSEVLDQQYLYYFMQSRAFSDQWRGRSNETDMAPYISLTNQRKLEVVVPPIGVQRSIAAALGTLDRTIDLNRNTNRNFESLAESLFRSWFIDFDPVVAKAAGREPFGMDAETAALFPDGFVDSELGPIPEGWAAVALGDLVTLNYGKSLPTRGRREGQVPVYGSGGITGVHSEPLVDGPGVIVGRKGSFGTVWWEEKPFFPIDTTYYFTANGVQLPLRLLYHILKDLPLDRMGTHTAVPGLNRDVVYAQTVVHPPPEVAAAFARKTDPFLRLQFQLEEQSQTLAALRDSLLPKLLSGEVAFEEAELGVTA